MNNSSKRPSLSRLLFISLFQRRPNNTHGSLQQQSSLPSLPASNTHDGWHEYWRQMGQSWRIEPEIDTKRQDYLAQRQAIIPDIKRGMYPFKDIKLSRADIEWLLAMHENGRGPVEW